MRDDEDLTDLIRAAAGGDRRAFEELVVRKRERVVRAAFQITGDVEDARDVAQGVFLRLWRVLQRFDLTRRFDTWLYRITVNAAIDFVRERGPRGFLQPLPGDAGERLHDPSPTADAAVRLGELQRAFLRLATRLAPKQRAAFVLKEIEGLETAEVARVLGVTESTVRNHLLQARRILREGLASDYGGIFGRRRGSGEGSSS
ncbi:MAG TPA: RNA polymerase sigma factor [Candidatus Polarisedimenticolaceae bacterium]|nr:RNA polymerase sigma factor [Candidatus Polarisedimenticolaceae bacterium]